MRHSTPSAPGSHTEAVHHGANFSPDALRRLLATTKITCAETFISGGRSIEDYRGSIWMYIDRFIVTGELPALAKSALKAVSLRQYLLDHPCA
ncbi:MAG: hypothetical protein CMJ83_19510 [Planctomycetes bacterium]|nr:hypothetical protein [Planctomycetota bacterium]